MTRRDGLRRERVLRRARARRREQGRRGTALAAAALALTVPLAASGCKTDPSADGSGGTGGSSAGSGPSRNDGHAVSPLDNPDGTKPGLAPITSSGDLGKARALIKKVATKGRGPKTGYERDKFGYAWMDNAPDVPFAHNGCDTRNDLLKRDGEDVKYRSGSNCVIVSLTLDDPYSGKTIHWTKSHATTIQIDHVMPLSYDWQMGASRWTKDKRESIANDPLNLIPVDGPLNGAKSDSGPASWLPPNKRVRCSYSVRVAQVSLKYDLPVTSADKQKMLELCGG
ncbi:HNH endonuclease family protein [Actinomadura nitritigenes]|uniref:HNH endonuclease family protein n=1 Tax=Actinomadura nitritigenes TaxID=134602 RepID=UPI003D8CB63E